MNPRTVLCALFAATALFSGCSSGCDGRAKPAETRRANEFTEYELLGLSPHRRVSEIEIHKALAEPHRFALHEGSGILLIQSGAAQPESILMKTLGAHYRVVTLSGIPAPQPGEKDNLDDEEDSGEGRGGRGPAGNDDFSGNGPGGGPGGRDDGDTSFSGGGRGMGGGMGGEPGMGGNGPGGAPGGRGGPRGAPGQGGGPRSFVRIDKPLRLAAARAGCDTVVVVWTNSPQKGVPAVRAAVMDVATGRWEMLEPEGYSDVKRKAPPTQEELSRACGDLAKLLAELPR